MEEYRIPVIIGVGRETEKETLLSLCSTPMQLMIKATEKAIADTGKENRKRDFGID